MRINLLSRTVVVALFVVLSSVAVAAQVTRGEGKVTLKQADGKEAPVADAVVEFFRTDISGKFQTKSDKSGNYVHAGLPFGGTFIIAASGWLAGTRRRHRRLDLFERQPRAVARAEREIVSWLLVNSDAGDKFGARAGGAGGDDKRSAEGQPSVDVVAALV